MSLLEFVAALIKALAWPAAIVVALILFRTEIRTALSRVRGAKIGPAEIFLTEVAEAQQDLTEAELETPAQPEPPAERPEDGGERGEREGRRTDEEVLSGPLFRLGNIREVRHPTRWEARHRFGELAMLAATEPVLAVLDAWRLVEMESNRIQSEGPLEGQPIGKRTGPWLRLESPRRVVDALVERHLLNPKYREVVRLLSDLRNAVAHGFQEVDAAGAAAFVTSAHRLWLVLNLAIPQAGENRDDQADPA